MSTERGQADGAAVRWAQEWQRLSATAINQALGHYLNGCANVAMTRTPRQALAAMHATQADLVRHSMETLVAAARLWRTQQIESPFEQTERTPGPRQRVARP